MWNYYEGWSSMAAAAFNCQNPTIETVLMQDIECCAANKTNKIYKHNVTLYDVIVTLCCHECNQSPFKFPCMLDMSHTSYLRPRSSKILSWDLLRLIVLSACCHFGEFSSYWVRDQSKHRLFFLMKTYKSILLNKIVYSDSQKWQRGRNLTTSANKSYS